MRMWRRVFSIAIAHTQTEQTKSPTMTVLTIQCACKNSVSRERSDELSPICGRSAGFMGYPFRLSGTDRPRGDQKEAARSVIRRSAEHPKCTKNRAVHHRHG